MQRHDMIVRHAFEDNSTSGVIHFPEHLSWGGFAIKALQTKKQYKIIYRGIVIAFCACIFYLFFALTEVANVTGKIPG